MWVLAEGSRRILDDPARIGPLLDDAVALGVSDLFVQVYRGGRAWFDSGLADATPYRDSKAASGMDSLSLLLSRAHDADLRVHAWVNALSLASNKSAPIVLALGRHAVTLDRHGRSVLDYPKLDVPPPDRTYYRMGTPAVWLDPGAPGVSEYISRTFGELMLKYPALDGLHLDYIRYPDVLPFVPGSRFGVGLDFGYGELTRRRFREETGLEAPFGDSLRNANRWDNWRRDQVTRLVGQIRSAMIRSAPNAALSAAVWTYADRAYLAMGQDWRGWLASDLLDFAVPMAYTLDDDLLRHQAQTFAGLPTHDRIWIGLGSWLFRERPERALEQLQIVESAGTAAEVLFSYDAIADAPELRRRLIEVRADGL